MRKCHATRHVKVISTFTFTEVKRDCSVTRYYAIKISFSQFNNNNVSSAFPFVFRDPSDQNVSSIYQFEALEKHYSLILLVKIFYSAP